MQTTPPALQRLITHLDAAVAAPPEQMAQSVISALGAAVAENAWLPPEQRRASHDNYTRHVLYGDPQERYTVVAIAWQPGQRSPIHGHYTWCGVGVYHGELTETFYREGAAGRPPALIRTVTRSAGALCFDPAMAAVHSIANLSGEVAVSLHVYGIGRERISIGVNRIVG